MNGKKAFRLTKLITCAVAAALALSALPAFAGATLVPWEKNYDGYYYGASQSGENLTRAEGVVCRGIDVSSWNGDINWEKISKQYKEGTISFVIIRCGFGGNRTDYDDPKWERNVKACTKYGIPFGVYLYSYAVTVEDALDEADHVLRLVDGYKPTYPIYYDFENTNISSVPGTQKRDMVYAFCDRIRSRGYEVGFYSMRAWITNNNHLGLVDYEGRGYSLWIAEFNATLKYTKSFDIWQCTSKYKLDGNGTGAAYCDVSFSYIEERTVDHCYVTFDLNGRMGEVPEPMHVNKGTVFGHLPDAATNTGEHIIGWFTEPTGGTEVTDLTVLMENGKLTLYAHWACDFELTAENATVVSGPVRQTVTAENKFQPVKITAADGFYLPSRIAVPEGYTYTRNDEKSATVTGDPHRDAMLSVRGVPIGELEPPVETDFSAQASSYGGSDGSVRGVTADMEISLLADHSDAAAPVIANSRVSGLSGTVYFRYAAADVKRASDWVAVVIPEKAQTPTLDRFTVNQPLTGADEGSIIFPDGNYEYSLDGGRTYVRVSAKTLTAEELPAWKKVYIRRTPADGYETSEALPVEIHPFAEEDRYDYAGEKLCTFTPLTTFIINDSAVRSDALGFVPISESWYGAEVRLYPASLADDPDRVVVTFGFEDRPAAPDGITVTDESIGGRSDGGISGLDTSMLFSTDAEKWEPVTEEMADGTYAFEYGRTYYFRYASRDGEDAAFRSRTVSCAIGAGAPLTVTFMDGQNEVARVSVGYGGTVDVPALPVKEEFDMSASAWDKDLSGLPVTEDLTVRAVYVKKGCGSALGAAALLPVLVLSAVIIRRGKRNGGPDPEL